MLLESAFYWLSYLKFSFKLVTFSKSYARKQKWVFFQNTVYVEKFHNVHCRLKPTFWKFSTNATSCS